MEKGLKFKTKSVWKDVSFCGEQLATFGDEALDGLISMQELTDYEIIGSPSKSIHRKKDGMKINSEVKKTSSKLDEENGTVSKTKSRRSSEKKKSENMNKDRKAKLMTELDDDEGAAGNKHIKRKSQLGLEEPKRKKKKHERKRKAVAELVIENQGSSGDSVIPSPSEFAEMEESDLPGWKGMFVPSPVLRALKELGFSNPTPIQALTLPSAIRDRKDILGAAETGSGKTLAFAIPLIHHILEKKALRQCQIDELCTEIEEDSSDFEFEEVNDETFDISSICSADTSDNEEFPPKLESDEERSGDDVDSDEERSGDDFDSDEEAMEVHGDKVETKIESASNEHPLYALILTPTRELAIQIQHHIQSVTKYTDITVVNLVGGMSSDKQRRLLKRRPEIVVATPGRLWDLMQEGQAHLAQIDSIPYFVIDECDRMVEKGHFRELSNILELMNGDQGARTKRQNFIFSATLTFVHDAPNRFKKKKKFTKLTSDDKVENLMSHIGINVKPKVVDLTRESGTAETLTETKIHCSVADKDVYLYYFLQRYPGRTLVFTNSKDCLRRILSILTLLQCNPLPLHADMHQKQRLKNMERFTASPDGLLVATDVAARGLDIPDVQHVLHFQVPQTTENYIHRSGRTARAAKEGLSFMIIGPDDIKNYRKILRSLKRTEDIPQLPVDLKFLPDVKDRVSLAKNIDLQEHQKAKVHHHNNWFIKAAKEMDIELEEDLLRDTGDSMQNSLQKSRLQQLRSELKSLLRTPVISQNGSLNYPTMSGRLVVPYMPSDQALEQVKNTIPLNRTGARAHQQKSKRIKSKRQKKRVIKT